MGEPGRAGDGQLELSWPELRVGVALPGTVSDSALARLRAADWIIIEAQSPRESELAAARERLVAAARSSTSRIGRDREQFLPRFKVGRLGLLDLDGADATRWRRIVRAIGQDDTVPDRLWATMRGDPPDAEIDVEVVDDLVAIGGRVDWPEVRSPTVSVQCDGTLTQADAGRFLLHVALQGPGSRAATQEGAVWTCGDRTWLLPPALRLTLDALGAGPPDAGTTERLLWWARHKAVLDAHGARLDGYLAGVEGVIVATLRARLLDGDDGPELRVSADGVSEEDLTRLADDGAAWSKADPTVLRRDPAGRPNRTTLRFTAVARAGIDRVRQLRERQRAARSRGITWPDLPRLLDAPETLLPPEAFDLSSYGDRVIGIGPVVYRVARASVGADAEAFVLRSADADGEPLAWTPAEQVELADRLVDAARKGDSYVRFRDVWVRVPPESIAAAVRAHGERRAAREVTHDPAQAELVPALNLEEPTYRPDDAGAGTIEDIPLPPPGLARGVTLLPHQVHGVRWLAGHARCGAGASDHGMLADDMGLGKTLQVLSLMAIVGRAEGSAPTLVVGPLSLLENWRDEANRFFPGRFKPTLVVTPGACPSPEAMRRASLVLVSYETLLREQLTLGRIEWRLLVLDESHRIRNPTTRTTRAVLAMNAQARLALTGTPVQNSVEDLWSQFDWLAPGLLGDLKSFRKRFAESPDAVTAEIEREVLPRVLRRLKRDVLGDSLPPKHTERVRLPMTTEQAALYDRVLADHRSSGQRGSFGAMHRLFMACAEPTLLSSDAETGPKLAWTLRQLDEIRAGGEKVIVFAEWYAAQDVLADAIERRFSVVVERLNGEVAGGRRLDIVRRFNGAPGFQVLILGPKAAGVGLNITGANHVIHFTRHWNPALEEQATDRAYRIGQTRPVTVYLPVVSHPTQPSIEEHLDALLEDKREMAIKILAMAVSAEIQRDLSRRMSLGRE